MDQFKARFEKDFPPEKTNALVGAIKRAYNSAADNFDEKKGSNANTFGSDVYYFGVHELSLIAEDKSNNIELVSKRPDFRLKANECTLAYHKVGSKAEQDINTSFPNNNKAAGSLARDNEHQLSLNFPDIDIQHLVPTKLNLVIAHLGNPFDGACAIYLCIPIEEENGRIVQWAYAYLLWKKEQLLQTKPSEVEIYPEIPIESPDVKLKKKDEQEKHDENE